MKTTYLLAILAVAAMPLTTPVPHASETDDRIESAATNSHMFKTQLKDDSIRASSKNGAVTLTGTVADNSHRCLARDTVESLPHVKSVDNQLVATGESPIEHSDAWIAMKVKTALLFHRNVNANKTVVRVRYRMVNLTGEASSVTQLKLTSQCAKDVEGVRAVRNDMKVVRTSTRRAPTTSEKIDDASISAQVKSSLRSHRSTSALTTKVETTNGVVTVTGIARNAVERSHVTKLVIGINGVTKAINAMTIASPIARN